MITGVLKKKLRRFLYSAKIFKNNNFIRLKNVRKKTHIMKSS